MSRSGRAFIYLITVPTYRSIRVNPSRATLPRRAGRALMAAGLTGRSNRYDAEQPVDVGSGWLIEPTGGGEDIAQYSDLGGQVVVVVHAAQCFAKPVGTHSKPTKW